MTDPESMPDEQLSEAVATEVLGMTWRVAGEAEDAWVEFFDKSGALVDNIAFATDPAAMAELLDHVISNGGTARIYPGEEYGEAEVIVEYPGSVGRAIASGSGPLPRAVALAVLKAHRARKAHG